MKVLIMMDCFRYGGLSKMMNWLALNLTDLGHRVTLCSAYQSEYMNRINSKVKFRSFNIKESNSKIKRNTRIFLNKIREYRKLCNKEQYDIVLTLGDPCIYMILLFKIKYKYKVVVSERVDPYYNRGMGDRIRRKLYYYCDGCVFQTDGAKNYFRSILKKKSIVIPNPVIPIPNLPQWNKDANNGNLIYAGRYDPLQKRTDILFEAFALALKKYPDLCLDVYGDGYDSIDVLEKCDMLNITSNVNFKGVTNRIYDVLAQSGIFVFTSDFEGIPNSVIEALMVGIPIVSTNCSPGGVKLLLDNGNYGYISECGNAREIADNICHVLENPTEAIEKAKRGKDSLDRFDEKMLISKWEKYFKLVLERE